MKIKSETNGIFFAFDYDVLMIQNDPYIFGMNYKYKNKMEIQELFNKLSNNYKILWINRYNNNISEFKNFDDNDKEIYKIIIDRIKK